MRFAELSGNTVIIDESSDNMRVLVACECSNTVRDAFLRLGHDAYSCDLQRADHPNPNWRRHIIDDVTELLRDKWDLVIAHPPCTYLSKIGAMHMNKQRLDLMYEGVEFFKKCLNANADRICVENPILFKLAVRAIGVRPTQTIQPYQFGHYERKTTWLWLKNLPPLVPTKVNTPTSNWVDGGTEGKGKGKVRNSKLRARTFQGIANAMASQWSSLPLVNTDCAQ